MGQFADLVRSGERKHFWLMVLVRPDSDFCDGNKGKIIIDLRVTRMVMCIIICGTHPSTAVKVIRPGQTDCLTQHHHP